MRHLLLALILMPIILALLSPANAAAFENKSENNNFSYSVDYIHGEGDVEGIKLGVQYHSTFLQQYYEKLSLYWESSINFWEYGVTNRHESNFVLSVSPVIQYPIFQHFVHGMFVEGGIGISFLDDTHFAGKNVSTHYQFEDRLGLIFTFGPDNKDQIALRYFHYSNAGIKKPNPGLDFIALSYMNRF